MSEQSYGKKRTGVDELEWKMDRFEIRIQESIESVRTSIYSREHYIEVDREALKFICWIHFKERKRHKERIKRNKAALEVLNRELETLHIIERLMPNYTPPKVNRVWS